MANLFPTGYTADTLSLTDVKKSSPTGYKKSIYFDDKTGDLVLDGSGALRTASGKEAWEQWCTNCIDTDRYSLPYSTDFGVDKNKIFSAFNRFGKNVAETIAITEITEALMADDYKRTKSVQDFSFMWSQADGVIISCVVKGIENETINLKTVIGGGEK